MAEGRWEAWVGVGSGWGDAGRTLQAENDCFRVATTPFLVPLWTLQAMGGLRPPLLNHHNPGQCHHSQAFLRIFPAG